MSRKAISIVTLFIMSFSAASADPRLAPGKPAGIKPAQNGAYGAIAVGALALIAIGGFAISGHPYKIPGAAAATSTKP